MRALGAQPRPALPGGEAGGDAPGATRSARRAGGRPAPAGPRLAASKTCRAGGGRGGKAWLRAAVSLPPPEAERSGTSCRRRLPSQPAEEARERVAGRFHFLALKPSPARRRRGVTD